MSRSSQQHKGVTHGQNSGWLNSPSASGPVPIVFGEVIPSVGSQLDFVGDFKIIFTGAFPYRSEVGNAHLGVMYSLPVAATQNLRGWMTAEEYALWFADNVLNSPEGSAYQVNSVAAGNINVTCNVAAETDFMLINYPDVQGSYVDSSPNGSKIPQDGWEFPG